MKKDKFKNSFNNLFGEIEPIIHEEVIETTSEESKVIEEEIVVNTTEEDKIKELEEKNKEIEEIAKATAEEEKALDRELIEEDNKENKIIPNRKKRNYYIPVEMLEEMEKVVYMDRELRGNYTELVLRALRSYLDTKQDLIKEYDELQGGNINE